MIQFPSSYIIQVKKRRTRMQIVQVSVTTMAYICIFLSIDILQVTVRLKVG